MIDDECVAAGALSGAPACVRDPTRRTVPSGTCAKRAHTVTASPSNTEPGSALIHTGFAPPGQASARDAMRCERNLANMRSTAGSTASPGATRSQAPPVSSARRRSTPSAGALPIPTTNTR